MLKCPICNEELIREEKRVVCKNNHSFDMAKQGYVNLSRKQKKDQGDNAQMVQARTDFLSQGYYDFLLEKLKSIVAEQAPSVYVDMGCGQGYYTKQLAQYANHSFGIDASKAAVSYAARQDKKTQYVVGNLFHIPLEDNSVDCLSSIFVPLAKEEASRLLHTNGLWITVEPGPRHCWQLKEQLYDVVKENPIKERDWDDFVLENEIVLSQKKRVEDLMALLDMTPYKYKSSLEKQKELEKIEALDVEFEFIIRCWRKV